MNDVPALLDNVHIAFQPVFNLHTGDVRDLLRHAADTGQLTPTDYGLAALAIRRAGDHDARIPLHVNVLASSVARAHVSMGPLTDALRETGRRPADVVLELNPTFSSVRWREFQRGVRLLRTRGFRLAVDGIGDGDAPMTMLGWPEIGMVKIDGSLTSGVPHEPGLRATVTSLVGLCETNDMQLVAAGVTTEEELALLRSLGVSLAQGDLLRPAGRRPVTNVSITPLPGEPIAVAPVEAADRRRSPRVTELMHPAATLPAGATADEVRT